MKSGSSSTWPSSRELYHSWWDSAEHPVTHWLFSLLLKQEGFGQKTSLANSSPPLHAGFQISCLDLLSGNVDLFFRPRRVSFPFPLSWSLPDYRGKRMTLLCSWLRMRISQRQEDQPSSRGAVPNSAKPASLWQRTGCLPYATAQDTFHLQEFRDRKRLFVLKN